MALGKKLLVAAVVLGAAWSGLWFGGRHLASGAMDEAAAAAGTGRGGADCQNRSFAGFPFSFNIDCGRTIVTSTDGVKAEFAGLTASAPLYRLGHVEARLASPASIEAPRRGVAAEAKFDAASGSAALGIGGASRLSGAVERLNLSIGGRAMLPLKSVAIGSCQAEIGASGSVADSLDVSVDARQIDLQRSSGSALPRLDIRARATLVGAGDTLRSDDQFVRWLEDGGRIRLDEIKVSALQTSVGASGNIGIDRRTGLITGKLRLRLVGLAGIPDLAEALSPGSREKAKQAVQIMGALTKLVDTPEGPAQEIDVNIANGVMIVGLIPVAMIPPLF